MELKANKFNWGERTFIMGILNRTPDSFSDGGKYEDIHLALSQIQRMAEEGADIIDIGGESTRPGALPVSVEEEIQRVVPLIKEIDKNYTIPISIDTYRAKTAEMALQAGADMINDVWGLRADPEMANVVAQYKVPICIMHNRKEPNYVDIIEDMKRDLEECIELAVKSGISEDKIILDPGVGFGKTYQHNIKVMQNLHVFKEMGFPVLLGISRKSIIGNTLNLPPEKRLEGTIAANVIGIQNGMDIIRVHDVLANKHAAVMTDRIVRKQEELWTK